MKNIKKFVYFGKDKDEKGHLDADETAGKGDETTAEVEAEESA